MAAQMRPRFRDLPDVDWASFADGEVPTYDSGTDTLTGETPAGAGGDVTQQDLSDAIETHNDDGTFVHNIVNTADLATDTELATHIADQTAVHGITNTANIILAGDSRLTDSRTPNGVAGGVLNGTFPDPGFAVDMATQAELDAVAAAGADLSDTVVLEPGSSERNVIEPSINAIPLVLKGAADQTLPLTEWRNSDDDDIATVVVDPDSSGHINVMGDNPWVELTGTGDGVTGPTVAVDVPDVSGSYLYAGSVYCYAPDAVADYAVLFTQAWSDAEARFQVLADGSVLFGDGTAAPDTTLERTAEGVLEVNGEAVVLDDDARLTDDRDPTTHSHAEADVTGLTAALAAKQPLDSDLTSLAALTTTSFGRGLLELANQGALLTAAGAAASAHAHAQSDVTNLTSDLAAKQPLDTDLTAIAALSSAADKVAYATGSGTWTLTDLSSFARTVLDDTDAAAARTTLQVAPLQNTYTTGEYYSARGMVSGAGTGAMTQSRVYYLAFVVDKSQAFDRIATYITANGTASSVVRLGIYNDSGGKPSTLLVDGGTVATDAGAAAIKAVTITQTLAPGFYWLAVCPQTAATATYARMIPLTEAGYLNTTFNGNVFVSDSITGAFASSPGVTPGALNPPVCALRAA